MSDRQRYTFSLTAEEAEVLDALACLAGYTGRAGLWVGNQTRLLVRRRAADPEIRALLQAWAMYREDQAKRGRPSKHPGLGIIDGAAR